jgi:hypothetical protein
MTESSFLGIPTSGWLAIAAFVYAAATFAIAWVTCRTSNRAIAAAKEATSQQITAAREATSQQIAAAREATSQQIAAAREAAVIQARASSVSNNRQQWINFLRDEVTGFLSDAELIGVLRDAREQAPYQRALSAHIFKVRLLLNPTEGVSSKLVDMLTDVKNAARGLSDEDRERIVSHTQGILKTEWERVKSGVRIPTKAATYSNLIAATIPI